MRAKTSVAPRQIVSARMIKALKQLQDDQQEVADLIPLSPNNAPSIVASMGESVARYEMANGNFDADGQYTEKNAISAIRSGSGVCSHTNNVLFRHVLMNEAKRAEEHQRARRRNTAIAFPFRPTPISLAINRIPHSFVLFGDPREASAAIVGDSFEALPIIKTWSNTEYNNLPYSIKLQTVTGGGRSFEGSTESWLKATEERKSRLEVDEYLKAHAQPPIGKELLANVLERYIRGGAKVDNMVTTAINPALIYESSEGEVFKPSVELKSYQRYRSALAEPLYNDFRLLTEERS